MTKYLYSTVFILFVFIISSCSDNTSTIPGDDTFKKELTQSEKALSESTTIFGGNLFKTVNEQEDPKENIFISPLSVSLALGMTYNGADGATKTAMEEVLEYNGLSTDDINKSYKSLVELFASLDKDVTFNIANSIWHPLELTPLEEFVNVNKTYFDAEVNGINFGAPNAKDIINGWVEDKTNGKIKDILDFIPPEAVMYLVNAIYFKASWTYEFDPENTYDGKFTTYEGTQVNCKMMKQKSEYQYYECSDFKSIELPYGDGDYSMTIFLPSADKNINDMITEMANSAWQGWNANYDKTELTLGLPKFNLECDYLLKDALTSMGMGIAFGGGADFSKIYGLSDLYIGRVIHKTFIEVNEEGTEAAASTVVEIDYKSAGETYFYLNRPFVFVIRENIGGTFMFMGKVTDPS